MDQQAIFKAIQDRFQELSHNWVMNMALLISLVLFIIFLLFLYRMGEYGGSQKKWREEYNRLIRRFDLTINEIDLLNRMAFFLDDKSRKNLLLTHRNTYHRCLTLLEKRDGDSLPYSESLTRKLFDQGGAADLPEGFDTLFGLGRPVRYYSPEGSVYGGEIILRENEKIILGKVHPLKNSMDKPMTGGKGRIFIQDFRGLVSHGVSKMSVLSDTSIQLDLSPEGSGRKNEFQLPHIYLFLPGETAPLESGFFRVSEGTGIVENPGGRLKMDQNIKVALQKDSLHHYHVNALVRGISLNKRYAKLKFGYLNGKFY